MPTNETSSDQGIDSATPFRAEIEAEEAAQQTQKKTSTAVLTNIATGTKSEEKISTPPNSRNQTSDNSEQEAEDLSNLEQPETNISEYTDEHVAEPADISGLPYEEAAKVLEDRDDYSEYSHPRRPRLFRPALNVIRVDRDQLVIPWWELEDEDIEITEDHLTINVFGE